MSPQVTTAIDADVQVQNGFGAMVHFFKYNLRARKAIDASVYPLR